jgi:outer membrane protein TolC
MFVIATAVFAAAPAVALQPLEAFVAAARERNPDALEARANLAQQSAQADVALGSRLPGISARGTYTRNQYQSQITLPAQITLPGSSTTTLVPFNQWDGSATLTVPLVDLAGFRRVEAANTNVEAATQQLAATRLQVESQTAQDYFQLVADRALIAAAENALEVSRESLRLADARRQAGTATGLDVDRARADVENQVQQLASARLQTSLAARALESTTGIAPDTSAVELVDDLHSEPDLAAFEAGVGQVPSVAAAAGAFSAARQTADAQKLSLLPSLAGSFAERATSAPGFVGHDWTYQAAITASWTFDLTSLANIRSQNAAADAAGARELRARLLARDGVHRQWNTVVAGIARSRSARVGREAAAHAADLARKSYQAGTVTQLELLQALRDSFSAEVARIQADADLVNARAQLRLAAGHSLLAADETNARRIR